MFVHKLLLFFFAFPLRPADIKNRNSPRSNLKFRFDKLSHGSSSTVGAGGSRQARCCAAASCPAGLQACGVGGPGCAGAVEQEAEPVRGSR